MGGATRSWGGALLPGYAPYFGGRSTHSYLECSTVPERGISANKLATLDDIGDVGYVSYTYVRVHTY